MRWLKRFAKANTPDVEPGQRSVPDEGMGATIGRLAGFYDYAVPDFPPEYLEVLEPLSVFNPDVSQALSIWVTLGNTGHEVAVDGRNPEAVLERLNYLAGSIYKTGGGMDGLVSHFLRQIPLMGALSAEWVVADRLQEGIADVAVVPVRSIRFKREDGQWAPYQFTGRFGESAYVALNPATYSYSTMQTLDGRPYGIPPWLSTLKNIESQLEGLKNINYILAKMGLIGFLDVSLEMPQQKPQESDEAFRARLSKRLKDYAAAYSANLSKGVAVHYKDQEAKHNSVSPGAAGGAKQIWQLNEEQICSGLDVPPSMMGRSYSTTETYAEVDYERLTTKLMVALRMIKRFVEKGYELDLLLRGIDADVTVSFNQARGFKELDKANADGLRIDNVIVKRDAGFIDDDEAARELGYEEATGRRGEEVPEGWFQVPGSRLKVPRVRFPYDRKLGRYVYRPERIHLAGRKDKAVQNYAEALKSVLSGPEDEALSAAKKAIAKDYDDEKAFAQAVSRAFADGLKAALSGAGVDKVSDRYVGGAWQAYRYEDTGYLQAAVGRISRGRLAIDIGLVDANAFRYLKAIDSFYFGKGNYLADHPTVQEKFVNWLQKEYLDKGLNIKDEQAQEAFFGEFSRLVKNTSWVKVNQLVETTMARVQNMGQTLKLYETGFTRYRIVGPRSGPICGYCKNMVGRVFSVEKAATRLAGIVEKGFESVEDLPGFITSAYERSDDMKDLSDEALQEAGFDSPPFHPECRHRKAAED